MGLFFVLLAFLPIFYNWYNPFNRYLSAIPMQNSLVQTSAFIVFMLSLFCSASMLPCGRYYYEPEGGYVGNPWVKFSYQYIYLYLAWIVHHLDILDHYFFQFFQNFAKRALSLYKKTPLLTKISLTKYVNQDLSKTTKRSLTFTNRTYSKFNLY